MHRPHQHRRGTSAFHPPVQRFFEDTQPVAPYSCNHKPQPIQNESVEDLRDLGELRFYRNPRHKRVKSYGGTTDLDALMQTMNEDRMREALELELHKKSLKQKLLELIAQPESEEETERRKHSNSCTSNHTCPALGCSDNRATLVEFVAAHPESALLTGLKQLPAAHYAVLLQQGQLAAVYRKEQVEFAKVLGARAAPLSLYEHMLGRTFSLKDQRLVPTPAQEWPDVLTLDSNKLLY